MVGPARRDDLRIINIRTGLNAGKYPLFQRVESVEIIPNRYVNEPEVTVDGFANSRLVEAVA